MRGVALKYFLRGYPSSVPLIRQSSKTIATFPQGGRQDYSCHSEEHRSEESPSFEIGGSFAIAQDDSLEGGDNESIPVILRSIAPKNPLLLKTGDPSLTLRMTALKGGQREHACHSEERRSEESPLSASPRGEAVNRRLTDEGRCIKIYPSGLPVFRTPHPSIVGDDCHLPPRGKARIRWGGSFAIAQDDMREKGDPSLSLRMTAYHNCTLTNIAHISYELKKPIIP